MASPSGVPGHIQSCWLGHWWASRRSILKLCSGPCVGAQLRNSIFKDVIDWNSANLRHMFGQVSYSPHICSVSIEYIVFFSVFLLTCGICFKSDALLLTTLRRFIRLPVAEYSLIQKWTLTRPVLSDVCSLMCIYIITLLLFIPFFFFGGVLFFFLFLGLVCVPGGV